MTMMNTVMEQWSSTILHVSLLTLISYHFINDPLHFSFLFCIAEDLSSEDLEWLRDFGKKRDERLKAAAKAAAADEKERPYKEWPKEQIQKAITDLEKERNEQMNKVLNEHKRSKEQISFLIQQIRAKQQQQQQQQHR